MNITDTRTMIKLTNEKPLNEQNQAAPLNICDVYLWKKFFSFLFYFSFELLTEHK